MSILDWLWHHDEAQSTREQSERSNEALKRILEIIPRLRMARRYRERLAPAIAISLRYENTLVASLPAAHEASASAWSSDPYLRAFFATPQELIDAFSRSHELRAHFDQNPNSQEACVVLGMTMTECQVLGVALEGDTVRHDVSQTTLCFGNHRVRICGRTELDLHQEIGKRLMDQLALEGLTRLAADRRELVVQGRERLQARLALLEAEGAGVRSMVGAGALAGAEELSRIQVAIDENARTLAALRAPTEVIELELERVCEVLSKPFSHVYLTKKRLRIDLMNVVQPGSAESGHEIEFSLARIPGHPPQTRAFTLVRIARTELLPPELHIDAVMLAL
jgi:hypothetical protein